MSRYIATIAAVAGEPAAAGAHPTAVQSSATTVTRRFATEREALAFKDEVLNRFAEVEVIIRAEGESSGGQRFFWHAGQILAAAVA